MTKPILVIDPDGNNESLVRKIADDVVNVILLHFSGLRERPVFEKNRNENILNISAAGMGRNWEQTMQLIRQVITQSMQVAHPRFFGHMDSGTLYISMVSDWVVSALNQNMLSYELSPLATQIEEIVISWLLSLCNHLDGEGIFVSGGTLANLTALLLALNQATEGQFREQGAWAFIQRPSIFSSNQAHYSIKKAAASVGLGENSIVSVATDSGFRMDISALERAIVHSMNAHQQPVMVVATVGTTSTGSVDSLEAIASICEKYNLWFHVDAAHGGAALFSSSARTKLNGIERADSITFDPHKWLMQPKGMGILLTRHRGLLQRTFQSDAPYLEREKFLQNQNRGSMTLQGSRRFDAFRLWLTRIYLGDAELENLINNNLHQTEQWVNILQSNGNFELAHKPDLNLVCFRYHPNAIDKNLLDKLNEWLQQQLMESGVGFVSMTTLHGQRFMRSVFINPTTTFNDMFIVLEKIESLAMEWLSSNTHD